MELVGHEDDETRSPTSFISWVVHHSSFKKEFSVLLKCDLTKEVFADQLRHILMYYFWSKCEWETVLKPWVGDMNIGRKIDVYNQVMLNLDKFVDYCWSFKSEKH